jgi:hypothetical protein
MNASPILTALALAETVADNARKAFNDYQTAQNKLVYDAWLAIGGCPNCAGEGYTYQHYHDGDSVRDDCSRKGKGCTAGTVPSWERYRSQYVQPVEVKAELERLYNAKTEAAERLEELNDASRIGKGKLVRVFKGRKVPIGTMGHVFWLQDGQWGLRIGMKDVAGEVYWTAAANVEVMEDAPKDTRPAAKKPYKGSKIKHGNTIGIVFWYGRGRDGVSFRVGYNAVNGKRVSKEATWADANEVELTA